MDYPSTVSGDGQAGSDRPGRTQVRRAYRLLNRSLEDFYGADYEHAIQRCGEALDLLLPPGAGASDSPEERGRRFLGTYGAVLPVREAEDIAGVFTFFQRRGARFRSPRGAPVPDRDWWRFIRIGRDEADRVIRATRVALNAIERNMSSGE